MEFSLYALTAIFPGKTGLTGVTGDKDNEGGNDRQNCFVMDNSAVVEST